MKVQDRAFVTLEYTLTLDSGEVIDQSEPGRPLGFLYASGQIIPGLEKAILGMEAGQAAEFSVSPEEGYGAKDEALLREIPRKDFPEEAEIKQGMTFQASGPHGPIPFRIEGVKDDVVLADFNHPLAGQNLNFAVTIAGVREATEQEIADAETHACGEGCCDTCGGEC